MHAHKIIVPFKTLLLALALFAALCATIAPQIHNWSEEALSRATGGKVTLGDMHLGIIEGAIQVIFLTPSFETKDQSSALSIKEVSLQFRPWLYFSNAEAFSIHLEKPDLRLRLPKNSAGTSGALSAPWGLPLNNISLSGGTVALDYQHGKLRLERLEGKTIRTDSGSQLTLDGELLQQDATASLRLRYNLNAPLVTAELRGFELKQLQASIPGKVLLQGKIDIDARATRTPAGEWLIQISLGAKGASAEFPRHVRVPLVNLRLEGLLAKSDSTIVIRQGSLRLNELSATFDAHTTDQGLDLTLNVPRTSMEKISPLLVSSHLPAGLEDLRGDISAQGVKFHIPDSFQNAPYLPAEGSIAFAAEGRFFPPLPWPVQLESELTFHSGRGELTGTLGPALKTTDSKLNLTGALRGIGEFDLRAQGIIQSQDLSELLHFPEYMNLQGALKTELNIRKAPSILEANLNIDLAELEASTGKWSWKRKGIEGELELKLTDNANEGIQGSGELRIDQWKLQGQGGRDSEQGRDWYLSLAGQDLPLERLKHIAPPLTKVMLQGKADLALDFEKITATPLKAEGFIDLKDASFAMPGPTGSLKEIEGRFLVSAEGLRTESLKARLETSPVELSARILLRPEPHLILGIDAQSVRADELVFRSPDYQLRDLHGGLHIDKKGIIFDDISFRLEDGTEATVNGFLENYHGPKVFLEVDAAHINVDSLIAMFAGDAPRKFHYSSPDSHPVSLHIHVMGQTRSGVVGQLKFENAITSVVYDQGKLSVYPLRIRSGPGYFVGRFFSDLREKENPQMSISGHLEQFRATDVQRYLGGDRGLIDGNLRGSFFLAGSLHREQFVETISGGIHLRTDEGTLYRFPILSKIFSLLNVTQILSFRLPDMSSEGMPFNRLEGNLRLDNGVLRTEDLFMDSEAMNLSLIGEVKLGAKEVDALLGVKPLKTVDKIVTNIPLAGWILAGEEKALVTAHFELKGPLSAPEVTAVPITSVSEKVVGILRRILGLPGKIITDLEKATR